MRYTSWMWGACLRALPSWALFLFEPQADGMWRVASRIWELCPHSGFPHTDDLRRVSPI